MSSTSVSVQFAYARLRHTGDMFREQVMYVQEITAHLGEYILHSDGTNPAMFGGITQSTR